MSAYRLTFETLLAAEVSQGFARTLLEKLSFDRLMSLSDPKRITRAATVRVPPLKFDAYKDQEAYYFNVKSSPSTTGLRHKGYVKVFKPKNPNTPLEKVDCEVDCQCFAPGTLVLMGDGTYRAISEIKPGDEVITHKGRVRRVTRNNVREVKPDENTYNIKVSGFPGEFTVTGEHPFYALRGVEHCACGCGETLWDIKESYLENRALTPRMLLGRRFIHGHNACSDGAGGIARKTRSVTQANPFSWVNVDDFREREWFLSPWVEGPVAPVQFDPELARLLGYYAAEGNILGGRGVKLTFSAQEFETIADDAFLIAQRRGYTVTKKLEGGNATRVIIRNREFQTLCRELVGCGSERKHLSPAVFSWDSVALQNLAMGMILGDGSYDSAECTVEYCSASRDLVDQLALIFSRLRLPSVVSHGCKRKGKGLGKRMFVLSVPRGGDVVRQWLHVFAPERFLLEAAPKRWTKMRTIPQGQLRAMAKREKTRYTGKVYDLTVEEDLTYTVHGVAVFDCPDYKYRWAFANKQRGSSKVGPNSLNQALNRAPRITNPTGRPGLCKHIIATRDYIYGQFRSFASDQDYDSTTSKLDRLVKHSQKRWANYPAEMDKAKERDRAIKQSIQRATELRAQKAKNPWLIPQVQPSAKKDAGSPALTKVAPETTPDTKLAGARAAGLDPELAKTGSAKAADVARRSGDDSIAAWRARRSEESTAHVFRGMSNTLVKDVNSLVEELEASSGKLSRGTAGRPGSAPNEEESEDLRLLRQILDIVRHLAGDDLPPELAKNADDEPLSEPGIPVDAARSREQN